MNKEKIENSWEKEFDKEFNNLRYLKKWESGKWVDIPFQNIKSFIRQILTKDKRNPY